MALQLGALRDALKDAGASDDLARRASEEVAGYEQRFVGVEQKIDGLERRLEKRLDEMERKADQRMDTMERKADQRFAAVDVRFATIDGKLDKLFWAISTIGALVLLMLGKTWFG